MTHGRELAEELRKGEGGGIPWSVVLDGEGKELINSGGPGKNFGCPVTEDEQARFLDMLKQTRAKVTDEEMATLAEELKAFAQPILDAQRKAREEAERRSRERKATGGGD